MAGRVLLLVGALALAGCSSTPPAEPGPAATTTAAATPPPTTTPPSAPKGKKAVVRYVYDGDTVQVTYAQGRIARVRLLGIDAPEDTTTVDCGGPQATAELRRLLPVGTPVRLVRDRTQDEHDRYGRDLRYVTKGAKDVDRALVRRGRAKVYVYGRPAFQRVDSYRVAEQKAQQEKKGLWGRC